MYGLTGYAPDYALLVVGANAGLIGMSREHLGLSLSLGIPLIIVITKVDSTPSNIRESTLRSVQRLLRATTPRPITPCVIRKAQDACAVLPRFCSNTNASPSPSSLLKSTGVGKPSNSIPANIIPSNVIQVCPIFEVSNVTGEGMDLLRTFLGLLPCHPRSITNNSMINATSSLLTSDPQSSYSHVVQFTINETYAVTGVGTVVSGTLMSGEMSVGDTVFLGPLGTATSFPSLSQPSGNSSSSSGFVGGAATYLRTSIKGIQKKRLTCTHVTAGTACSLALKKIRRGAVRKGAVLVGGPVLTSAQALPGSSSSATGTTYLPPISNPINNNNTPVGGTLSSSLVGACREFEAEVLILFHSSTTITCKYQAMLHCGVIRQTVQIVHIDPPSPPPSPLPNDKSNIVQEDAEQNPPANNLDVNSVDGGEAVLRTGDRRRVRFKFMWHPEWMHEGARLLFREGRTKGVGRVVKLFPLGFAIRNPTD